MLFLEPACVQICPTWMTSWWLFEKWRGWVCTNIGRIIGPDSNHHFFIVIAVCKDWWFGVRVGVPFFKKPLWCHPGRANLHACWLQKKHKYTTGSKNQPFKIWKNLKIKKLDFYVQFLNDRKQDGFQSGLALASSRC